MQTSTFSDYRARVAELVAVASSGTLDATTALTSGSNLTEKGLTSLDYLHLIDMVETEYGIYVDLEGDTTFMETVDGIARRVETELATS